MKLATVTTVTPLAVKVKGDTTVTVVQQTSSAVPAMTVGDTVLVDVVERRLVVLHKIVAA